MKHIAIILASLAIATGCTDDDNTVRTLKAFGFSNIETTGYDAFECGQDGALHTGCTVRF